MCSGQYEFKKLLWRPNGVLRLINGCAGQFIGGPCTSTKCGLTPFQNNMTFSYTPAHAQFRTCFRLAERTALSTIKDLHHFREHLSIWKALLLSVDSLQSKKNVWCLM
ncbi:hypothetical protein FQA47_022647 [Oryzias melastigma]|uniref:Uncharacterized protein n=1 Tax=Oryzias melastigma TaxID=30732 RepID=A0A834CIJ2_ORYME|nr:hypothetical protein FQA47_022647 [Oryzias melastigma]